MNMNHEFSMLSTVDGPAALRSLAARELDALAREMRAFLVSKVSRTGGHLGPNLGIVELTIALHRVFDSPTDRIVFDTGHQAYVHKMITGRTAGFDRLRQRDGLSGYPSRAESVHDLVENSHASTALSYADGLAKAAALRGERRHIVAVVGDGALTGGMCWEAMNNIAAAKGRPVVIVVNDNGRSYAPTLGGFAEHLASLRLSPGYEQFLDVVRKRLGGTPVVGPALYRLLHAAKEGLKDAFSPQALFDDLGIKYLGPVPGHDIGAVEHALRRARGFGQPVVVHVVTRKGNGFEPAEQDAAECLHSPPPFDPATGRPTAAPALTWTSVFADELVRIGRERDDVVAITAAMPGPTGVIRFAEAYPERFYDVGIAEQHAVTSAAGLAMGGIHPIVAVYSTFLNRAFDQVLLDVALHRLPVTFVADRAGITGPDGPSHYGIWDLALFGMVPGLRIAAPRDANTLRATLREAMDVCDGPTLVRFPTGAAAPPLPVVESIGGVDVLYRPVTADALMVAVGAFASLAVAVAQHLSEQYGLLVVSPRWPLPVPAAVADLAREHEIVFTIEDGIRTGGVGDAVARALRDDRIGAAVHTFGVPPGWHPPGSRAEVLASVGLTVEGVAAGIADRLRENTVVQL